MAVHCHISYVAHGMCDMPDLRASEDMQLWHEVIAVVPFSGAVVEAVLLFLLVGRLPELGLPVSIPSGEDMNPPSCFPRLRFPERLMGGEG
jgi:hypothetical protein